MWLSGWPVCNMTIDFLVCQTLNRGIVCTVTDTSPASTNLCTHLIWLKTCWERTYSKHHLLLVFIIFDLHANKLWVVHFDGQAQNEAMRMKVTKVVGEMFVYLITADQLDSHHTMWNDRSWWDDACWMKITWFKIVYSTFTIHVMDL